MIALLPETVQAEAALWSWPGLAAIGLLLMGAILVVAITRTTDERVDDGAEDEPPPD